MKEINILIKILFLNLFSGKCESKLLVDSFISFFKDLKSSKPDDILCTEQFKYFLDEFQQNEIWALECKLFKNSNI